MEINIEDELSCAICMEFYDSTSRVPKCLPCSHPICLPCATSIVHTGKQGPANAGSKITCPECRTEHTVKDGPSALPNHIVLIRLLETHKKKCREQQRTAHQARLREAASIAAALVETLEGKEEQAKQTVGQLGRDASRAHKEVDKRFTRLLEENSRRSGLHCGVEEKASKSASVGCAKILDKVLSREMAICFEKIRKQLNERKEILHTEIGKTEQVAIQERQSGYEELLVKTYNIQTKIDRLMDRDEMTDEELQKVEDGLSAIRKRANEAAKDDQNRIVVEFSKDSKDISQYGKVVMLTGFLGYDDC